MKKSNMSALAMQITLFHYPSAAFVHRHPKNAAAARGKTKPPLHPARGPRHHVRYASSTMAKSQASSSCSSADFIELLPAIRRRHPLFAVTNAVSRRMPAPQPQLWRRSLPTPSPDGGKRKNVGFWDFLPTRDKPEEFHHGETLLSDRHVEFDDPALGARQLLEKCGVVRPSLELEDRPRPSSYSPETKMAEEETVEHLASVLSYFQRVAAPSHDPRNVRCVARAVSTRGSVGTKCPRWHADHVPVRLVMSVLGPGCEYIPEGPANETDDRKRVVNREALNNLDTEDTKKANDIIVPPKMLNEGSFPIRYADEGEAVLLMGRGWEDPALPSMLQGESNTEGTGDGVLAAVHRSPTLLPGQERILLTVDLVDW